MNDKTKIGLEILQAAVLLGVLGDLLLRQSPWGLNAFIWFGLLGLAMIAITVRRKREYWNSQTMALHGALFFFAFTYVWRDSFELKFFSFLAILTILSVQILPALGVRIKVAGAIHYLISAVWAVIGVAFGGLLLAIDDIKWSTLPKSGASKHLGAVAKGLAIALPIVFVFGLLFMAADAAFEGLVQNTFRIEPDVLVGHAILTVAITWLVAGYLRATTFDVAGAFMTPDVSKHLREVKTQVPSVTQHISEDPAKEESSKKNGKGTTKKWSFSKFDNSIVPKLFTLGAIETGIVLGLINLLFLSFVIVQIPYLFGGMDLVQSTPDFKLAEYARRGFGELIVVASLVLPILLLTHWLLRKDKPLNEKLFRALAGIQIGLLFIIMASAAQRLLLLTGNLGYGLTAERLYPIVFIILLAMIFMWFAVTVLRGVREQFAWGALWSALFMLGTLHVLNPDDFIVRTNVNLMKQGRTFDRIYNTTLSNDAVPALLESLPLLSEKERCFVKQELLGRLESAKQENDIRSWSYSRWVARTQLESENSYLNYEGCPNSINRSSRDDY